MLIDWFTVGAQALNFLILVVLLRRLLYKPILHAIDARERKIAAELADADAKKAEAQKERDEFEQKNAKFDQERMALLSRATEEARGERERLLEEARKAADAMSAKRQQRLESDARSLNQAIARRTQQEVFAIARRALADLATESLEERVAEVFTRRLREMSWDAKGKLGEALKTGAEPGVVRSAFELPADQCASIQNALNETFAAEIRVRFETSPELISGIELTAKGQSLFWSIKDYLASLERGVGELLNGEEKARAKAAPKPKTESKAGPKVEQKSEAKAEAKVEPKPEAAVEPRAESRAGPKLEAKAAPKPEETAANSQ